MRARLVLMAAALAAFGGGCGLLDRPSVVMVSGRDDHGLLERRAIGLQASPTDPTVVGTVEDGTFMLVTRRDGPWAYVKTPSEAAGVAEEGWIPDQHLRGEAVLVDPPPPRRVTFTDAERMGGVMMVNVRFADGTGQWVPATSLREVGAR